MNSVCWPLPPGAIDPTGHMALAIGHLHHGPGRPERGPAEAGDRKWIWLLDEWQAAKFRMYPNPHVVDKGTPLQRKQAR